MYNLIAYSINYSKTSGSLWQCYRNEPVADDDGSIVDFRDDLDGASFKY